MTAVRSNLTPKPSFEGYINIAGMMATINSAMAEMGSEPTKVPADVLPLGASLSVRESGLAGRFFVPTATAKFTYQSIMPMIRMLTGGMGGISGDMGAESPAGPPPPASPDRRNPRPPIRR